MGNLLQNVYETNPQLNEWRDLFERLGMNKKYVKTLYSAFSFINEAKTRTIPIVQLVSYLGATKEEFGSRVFGIFDEEKTGMLHFGDFVVSLWNFLTLEKDDLGKFNTSFTLQLNLTAAIFTFKLYANADGEVEGVDIATILQELNGKRRCAPYYTPLL